jgi:Protein of unknown function (DUF3606)
MVLGMPFNVAAPRRFRVSGETVPHAERYLCGLKRGRHTMADNTLFKGVQDRTRINLSEDYEVRYWCEKFGVTEDELRSAVRRVGNSAKAVESELGG